jgi:hypothetical protein
MGTEARLSGWFPPWPRGKPDFARGRMKKINLGTVRYVGLRCVQVVVYSSVIFNWVGVKPGFWSVGLPICCGLVYGFVDYFRVIPQEMNFLYDKTLGFRRLEGKVDEINEKL